MAVNQLAIILLKLRTLLQRDAGVFLRRRVISSDVLLFVLKIRNQVLSAKADVREIADKQRFDPLDVAMKDSAIDGPARNAILIMAGLAGCCAARPAVIFADAGPTRLPPNPLMANRSPKRASSFEPKTPVGQKRRYSTFRTSVASPKCLGRTGQRERRRRLHPP